MMKVSRKAVSPKFTPLWTPVTRPPSTLKATTSSSALGALEVSTVMSAPDSA